jgi:hypothetical protein
LKLFKTFSPNVVLSDTSPASRRLPVLFER